VPGVLDAVIRFSGGGSFETEEATARYLAEHPNAPVKTLKEIVLSTDVLPTRRTRLMESIGHSTQETGYLLELLAREQLRQATLQVMADHRLDALVYATFDHVAALTPADVMTRTVNPVQPGNNRILSPLIGFPALSVPAGFTLDGIPVGIELLGRPFTEGLLFQIAYGFEQATHHRAAPKTTPALDKEP
jgi:Asp-tRNA(Asn)/Glu-tRNA(Gln) amidotransferase A subunit family amidase